MKIHNRACPVVRVYNNGKSVNIRRPIKLLYPVELTREIAEESIDISGPQITDGRTCHRLYVLISILASFC